MTPDVTDLLCAWGADDAGFRREIGSQESAAQEFLETPLGTARHDSSRCRRYTRAACRVEAWRDVTPSDLNGVMTLGTIPITPDGSTVVYGYSRNVNQLYLVSGLR